MCVSLWPTECHARCRHVHDSRQVLFLIGLKHPFFQLLASINSRQHIWGGAGNGKTPLFREDLSSPVNTCRGNWPDGLWPGCSQWLPCFSLSLLNPEEKTTPALRIPLYHHQSPISGLQSRAPLSQELAFCIPFSSSLPFGYDSNLTNYFSTKSTGPRIPFPISIATNLIQVLDIPNSCCYLWPLRKVFLASRLSPPALSTISIMSSPSLLFIILN